MTPPELPRRPVAQLPARLVEAASWRLAARLVAALPGARVLELHPGGGMYDVLAVISGGEHAPAATFHINRAGGLHTLEAPHVGEESVVVAEHLWPLACAGGVETLVQHVLIRAGLTAHVRQRSRAWLTYEVIGHLLTARIMDEPDWSARSLLLDASDGTGLRLDLLPPTPDTWWVPPAETWAVTADGVPTGWLRRGWMVRPNGERLDLADRFARGATIADLAADVARRGRGETVEPIGPSAAWLRWAGSYNGYELLAATPEKLADVLEPARREYRETGRVPAWCGQHLLRGWLFFLYRQDHHQGGGMLGENVESAAEWIAVVAALLL